MPKVIWQPKVLSLEEIFESEGSIPQGFEADKLFTLVATGDIIPARAVNYQTVSQNNYIWPYIYTADILKSADLTLSNLEAPLLRSCPVTQTGMVFCGLVNNIEGLLYAGIDVVNVSNNHFGNYGQKGIEETVRLLSEKGIMATGTNGPIYKQVRGSKIALLGYNIIGAKEDGLSWMEEDRIIREISEARKAADIIVVSAHWGDEYTYQPNERQIKIAHLMVDSGADLVIGNHPHWIQPIEIYRDRYIVYAHGNYIFDQMWSQKTREGIIGTYTFYNNHIISIKFIPIVIEDYGQARFPAKDQGKRIIETMKDESFKLKLIMNESS